MFKRGRVTITGAIQLGLLVLIPLITRWGKGGGRIKVPKHGIFVFEDTANRCIWRRESGISPLDDLVIGAGGMSRRAGGSSYPTGRRHAEKHRLQARGDA